MHRFNVVLMSARNRQNRSKNGMEECNFDHIALLFEWQFNKKLSPPHLHFHFPYNFPDIIKTLLVLQAGNVTSTKRCFMINILDMRVKRLKNCYQTGVKPEPSDYWVRFTSVHVFELFTPLFSRK